MVKFTWFNDVVPNNMKIGQVWGVVFNLEGKILLKYEEVDKQKIYSLAGGTPETFDTTLEDTLKREFLEEINTKLDKAIYYLGYQEVDECNGKPKYAQVRMTTLVNEIGEKKPDSDTGKIYGRVLVSPENAIKLLNWKNVGDKLISKAVEVIKTHFNINIYEGNTITEI